MRSPFNISVGLPWLIGCISLSTSCAQSGDSRETYSKKLPDLNVHCKPQKPRAGQPIDIVVTISNPTKKRFYMKETRGAVYRDIQISAKYPNGNPVPKTVFGRTLAGERTPDQTGFGVRFGGSRRLILLEPGKTVVEIFPLSLVFDMSVDTPYRVTVSRSVHSESGKETVLSKENIIQVGRPLRKSGFTINTTTDTDSDGMDDNWEIANFGDLSHDGTGNGDSDGLTDLEEFQNNTDPNDADTDDDGLNDGAEVNTYGTNPTSEDTDGDGMSDGREVAKGFDP